MGKVIRQDQTKTGDLNMLLYLGFSKSYESLSSILLSLLVQHKYGVHLIFSYFLTRYGKAMRVLKFMFCTRPDSCGETCDD